MKVEVKSGRGGAARRSQLSPHGERGARVYNGYLRVEPQQCLGTVEANPSEAESILALGHRMKAANLPYSLYM